MNRRLTSVILTIILLVLPGVHALGQQTITFDPAQLADLDQAVLYMNLPVPDLPNSGTFVRTLTNPDKLAKLVKLLSEAEKMDHGSGCGFEKDIAFLVLRTKDGQDIRLSPAPDSCTVYQINGAYYYFMPIEYRGKPDHSDNRILYDLFDPADPQVTESSDAAAEFARLLETVKAERKALAMAQKELAACADIPREVKARLKPDINFTYTERDMTNTWHIMFRDPEDPGLAVLYSVMIDQETRQITESIGPDEGNG